jgi:hypothetical protein
MAPQSAKQHGEKSPNAKLKNADVLAIRKAMPFYDSKEAKHLAAQYGISSDNVRAIVQRQTWKHI